MGLIARLRALLRPELKLDLSGIPTHECICGCDAFKTVVRFEEGVIVWYTLTGYCYQCGARVTLPTPADMEAFA